MEPTLPMSKMNSTQMGTDCLGNALPVGGGTWIGHVIPGSFFFIWGIFWALAAFKRHIHCQSSGQIFTSRAWYPIKKFGGYIYAIEPFCKIIAGPIGIAVELYFDSKDGFRPLLCKNSGEFAMKYAHNYQHASMYPAFVISGVVDFLGMNFRLPPGVEQVFVGIAFAIEGLLMLVHKKHLPLDGSLHTILAVCMCATAVGIFLELRAPHNFLISCFKSLGLSMHGLWMILMGQMLFTGSRHWTDDYTGPAMLAPPYFAMWVLTTAFLYLIVYLIMDWWHQRRLSYTSLPTVSKSLDQHLSPLSKTSTGSSMDDSAIEASDDGLESLDSLGDSKQNRKFSTAINKLKLCKQPSKSNEHLP